MDTGEKASDLSLHFVTEAVPLCYLCGTAGVPLHADLTDSMGNAPGVWGLKRCPARDCGLVWLDPRLVKHEVGRAYASYFTHSDPNTSSSSWIKQGYQWLGAGYLSAKFCYHQSAVSPLQRAASFLIYLFPVQRARLERSVMYLPSVPGGRLLEVGCGSGSSLWRMRELGWECEGIDFDPEAVRNATRKGLNVLLGELRAQAYPDAIFDAIVMSHVIEHVYDPRALLADCHRVLKPGGRLVLITPNLRSLGHRIYGASWQHLDPPRHLHLFSAHLLARVAVSAGFRPQSSKTTSATAYWVLRSSRQIKSPVVANGVSRITSALVPLVLQYAEWLLLKVDLDAGEEIALVLEK